MKFIAHVYVTNNSGRNRNLPKMNLNNKNVTIMRGKLTIIFELSETNSEIKMKKKMHLI